MGGQVPAHGPFTSSLDVISPCARAGGLGCRGRGRQRGVVVPGLESNEVNDGNHGNRARARLPCMIHGCHGCPA